MIIDSSSLIIFGKINELDIPVKVFGNIEIVESVYDEIVVKGSKKNKLDASYVKNYVEIGLIKVLKSNKKVIDKVDNLMKLYPKLGKGELETISYALANNINGIVMDEKIGRKVSRLYGVETYGFLRVLLLAYLKKIINEKKLREIISKALREDFWVSALILDEFWKAFDKIKKKRK